MGRRDVVRSPLIHRIHIGAERHTCHTTALAGINRACELARMRLNDSKLPSGNGYKIHLLLAQLGLSYQTTELDILASPSETRTAPFLAKNPNGRIPLLELDDG